MLPYLRDPDRHNYDIRLEAAVEAEGGGGGTVTRSNFRHLCAHCLVIAVHVSKGAQSLLCNYRSAECSLPRGLWLSHGTG